MASSEVAIDLTMDSDDEPGPLDAILVPPNPSPLRDMAAPLPGSIPRLPQQTSVPRNHVPIAASASQSSNTLSTRFAPENRHQSPYTPPLDTPSSSKTLIANRPANGTGYVPVFNSFVPGQIEHELDMLQGNKRRKVIISNPTPRFDAAGLVRPRKTPPPRFYGVRVGHVPGVYTDWPTVEKQIRGCKGSKQQRFNTREEAQDFVDGKFGWGRAKKEEAKRQAASTNAGAEQRSMQSPTTPASRGANQGGTKTIPPATHPASGPPTTMPAKLSINGLPSVQSSNMALKSITASMPLAGSQPDSQGRRELHIGRAPDAPHAGSQPDSQGRRKLHIGRAPDAPHAGSQPDSQGRRKLHIGRAPDAPHASGAVPPAPSGLAIAQSPVDEMVVDQDDSVLPRSFKLGRSPVEEGRPSVEALSENKQGDVSKGKSAVAANPFESLLEDDLYDEMLSQTHAGDKIALLLGSALGEQPAARIGRLSTIARKPTQKPTGPTPLRVMKRPTQTPSDDDGVSSLPQSPEADGNTPANNSVSSLPAARHVVATVEQPSASHKWTGGLSLVEAHLLIFLKEVKKLTWKEITTEFQKFYPNRAYGILQTNYSHKINRRDRSQDPPTLILPPTYTSEAQIDWTEVHANPTRPNDHSRQRKHEVDALHVQPQHGARSSAIPAWPTAVDHFQDHSSGAESSTHSRRPRRAVPVKDYTWPKKRNTLGADDSLISENLAMLEPEEERFTGSESPEDLVPAPEKAAPVDNEPVSVDFNGEDAFLTLTTRTRDATSAAQRLPYLSSTQRSDLRNVPRGFDWDQLISRDWSGALIHVDFSPTELDVVERTISRLLNPQHGLRSRSQRRRLQRPLHGITEPDLLRLSSALRSKLHSRDRRSIDAFLRDAKEDKIRCATPRVERLAASRPNKSFSSKAKLSVSSMIRKRETGIQSHRGWSSATKPLSYQLKNKLQDSLGPVCSYTGASSDVHAVAWSVDGECFAAGAICVDDPHSMQYNRSNNLLYGNVFHNTINELGEHYVTRPKPESGPNSTHAMYASQDPKLFKTVTSVAFSPNGRFMFSGGWDNSVRVWETKYDGSQPSEIVKLHHKAEVNIMAVNQSGVLATATKKPIGNSVKVLHINEDDPAEPPNTANFSSDKAAARPDMSILPTALHFSPRYDNLLLGGFGAHVRQDGRDMSGDICLWDVNGNKQLNIWGSGKNVFDLSFHPWERWFAVGTVAGQNTNRGTRSTVRVYSEQDQRMDDRFSMVMELECRALDINDVVWCPGNSYLVAAGCTSGRAYVWDVRNPNQLLRELAHGSSLTPLDEGMDRELTDTGIRFLTWGDNATRLYSGSSDGVVKVWDVARSEEEIFVKDLITLDSGIMSGAFSPDRSRLLLGEVNGSVNVLEVGRDNCSLKDAKKMKFVPYADADEVMHSSALIPAHADSGIAAAKELLETGQITTIPMGSLPIRQAVQGPVYAGPFDASVDAPFLREQALEMQLQMAQAPTEQCSIPTCQESVSKITSEETGDSGRSVDRIPDELHVQWKAGPATLKLPPGKVACSSCGRAARPSDKVDASGEPLPPECERCAFTCFRCGRTDAMGSFLGPVPEFVDCHFCHRTWAVGALGYDLVRDSRMPFTSNNGIPQLKGYKKNLFMERVVAGDDDASFGDEVNALTEHYFSLAIDRPESPPL